MKGWLPKGDVDHRDGNRLNNHWVNLRAATKAQNCQNLKRPASSKGYPPGCVWLESRQKWQVYIGVNGKRVFIGLFASRGAAAGPILMLRLRYIGNSRLPSAPPRRQHERAPATPKSGECRVIEFTTSDPGYPIPSACHTLQFLCKPRYPMGRFRW
jgi:hypothetical protein